VDEQQDFLSPKHGQLLNIAIWAKYLAWVALIANIIQALLTPLYSQIFYAQAQGAFFGSTNFWDMIMKSPLYYLADIFSKVIITLLKGAIFYISLKGISLGLYMIVETDNNYREKESQQGMP
jgi:hypothetical protein